MQAPRCAVCDASDWQVRRFELVRFADAPVGAEITGPQGIWFCPDHAHFGRERRHLTTSQAIAQLRPMDTEPPQVVAHYVLLDHDVLLTKRRYESWREIQDAWPDYKTSLGPWSEQDLIEYLEDDFPDEATWPFTRAVIAAFYSSAQETIRAP